MLSTFIAGCIFVWGLAFLIFVVFICVSILRDKNNYNLTEEDLNFLITIQNNIDVSLDSFDAKRLLSIFKKADLILMRNKIYGKK